MQDLIQLLGSNLGVTIGVFIFLLLMAIIIFAKKYVRIFEPNIFYVHLRKGKAISQGEGGMVIRIPFFDRVLIVDRTVQQLNISAEEVLSKEKQKIKLKAVLQWQAVDAISTINNVRWEEIPSRLTAIIESVIRTACAQLSVEEILEERQKIIEAIKKELVDIVMDWGLAVITVELVDVAVVNDEFLRNMAKPREAEMQKTAKIAQIQSEQETGMMDIARSRLLKSKEIEMSQEIGLKEQEKLKKIQEAEKLREQSVLKIELEKQVMQKEYEKRQAEIEAAKQLEVAKMEAEAEKQRKIKQEVEVEAAKILQKAKAQAQQIQMLAEADAERILKTSAAQAEGLRKMIEAANEYTPQAFSRDFLQVLPKIYENVKVGDITLFGGAGAGTTEEGMEGAGGAEAFKVFGQVLLPAMMLSKMLGLDVKKVMGSALGEFAEKEEPKPK